MFEFRFGIIGAVNYYNGYMGISEWKTVTPSEVPGILSISEMLKDEKDVEVILYLDPHEVVECLTAGGSHREDFSSEDDFNCLLREVREDEFLNSCVTGA